jgi:ribosomal protein L37AE/L43A
MQEEINSSKDLQNCDIELKKEEPVFRTVKSCPSCHSIAVTYRKWKGAYWCGKCQNIFKDPVFKQIKDRRNELHVPPTLRKQRITEQKDKI